MNDSAALQKEIETLREQLSEKDNEISRRDSQLAALKEEIQRLLLQRFGRSSEKVSADQLGLFNEAEELAIEEVLEQTEATTVKSHEQQSRPRISIPTELPREEIIHDLPESEKLCPKDGTALEVIGSEDHEQLDIIPAQIKVLVHRRLKYACPCCEQHIVTAAKPKQPIEKSIANPGLLAYIAVQKYADALPLYRQSEMFKRIGIALDRTNLANCTGLLLLQNLHFRHPWRSW
ncbi:IS66 family transposase zinc-finger binding domain-containing protein [Halioxenophilus sp. WMMB6]|uniref:IS66 family transposase zinc-finger binding domain-containing protein n=1 Tax=Halioxenophilus sp. WMMB6 TaxID=3073815 RepID=UPI00295E94F9|nr:IS66 family transposase zinc-finger binding domain-containing protein [Halioxenophilus sp. WMMB6]